MASKIGIINDCLLATNENVVVNADDGSREWNAASAAYDAGVEHLLDEHDWKFGTAVEIVDERLGDSPDPHYDDQYAKPAGCLHVIWVRNTDSTGLDWKIIGNTIVVSQTGGILVKFVREPEPGQWPGLFVKTLRHFVMAGIYRGIKNDAGNARAEEKAAEFYLAKARPRGDSEEPGRARFISTLSRARSTRRF